MVLDWIKPMICEVKGKNCSVIYVYLVDDSSGIKGTVMVLICKEGTVEFTWSA